MPHWTTQQLQALLERSDPQDMFDHAAQLVDDLGMVHIGLSLHLHVAARPPQIVLYNNYPDDWNAHYQDPAFIKQDPIAARCHRSTLPVLWQDALYDEAPDFRALACRHGLRHGLRHGWTQSVHDLRHNQSQLSVSRPEGVIDVSEFYEKAAQVMWLCHTLHALISEHHLASMAPAPTLSERELEVLKWSAVGKTAADVACILSLSTSTVNFHIRSVISKTNAANKAGAIAIAVSRGLI
ncbi:autoinducer binding domain-containing protein [Pseudomonas entomophila]|uniref:autoinducer binding domain-containing protein n=1 Tax=Pseudomonas entomophila TaxID=312306 RepID=UPI0023D7BBD7|nr:autoinducer binding domain-containing protein [Pseudomonas entomophila]MDF0730029.1 autoinducer binding domain-containing protein [Pseudomonas entomophila]